MGCRLEHLPVGLRGQPEPADGTGRQCGGRLAHHPVGARPSESDPGSQGSHRRRHGWRGECRPWSRARWSSRTGDAHHWSPDAANSRSPAGTAEVTARCVTTVDTVRAWVSIVSNRVWLLVPVGTGRVARSGEADTSTHLKGAWVEIHAAPCLPGVPLGVRRPRPRLTQRVLAQARLGGS